LHRWRYPSDLEERERSSGTLPYHVHGQDLQATAYWGWA
jgi:hypothetical protein